MNTFAVDADIIVYRIAFACEDELASECDDALDNYLSTIAQDTGITKMRLYLTGKGNFRYDVAVTKPYKGNRKGLKKPQHLAYCREYLQRVYGAIVVDGYEADDAIASDMVQNGAFHCGIDKDIKQIAGKHYDFVNKIWDEVSPEQAKLRLYAQILTGDSTDNIQGLPNVGEKTAYKIIYNHKTCAQDAKDYYKEICAKKLPDVDVATYWKEQVQLIELVKDLDIMDLVTANIKYNGFPTETSLRASCW